MEKPVKKKKNVADKMTKKLETMRAALAEGRRQRAGPANSSGSADRLESSVECTAVDRLILHPHHNLVPKMKDSERRDLLEDVRLRGITVPLDLDLDGRTILDGRHRYEIALELKLKEVPTRQVQLRGEDPQVFMLKAALLRRHLTDDQRAILAVRIAEANPEPRGRKADPQGVSLKGKAKYRPALGKAARGVNVSMNKAVKGKNLSEELRKEVASGDLSIAKATRMAKPEKVAGNVVSDVVSALINLGYKPKEAKKAALSGAQQAQSGDVELVLREALKNLRPISMAVLAPGDGREAEDKSWWNDAAAVREWTARVDALLGGAKLVEGAFSRIKAGAPEEAVRAKCEQVKKMIDDLLALLVLDRPSHNQTQPDSIERAVQRLGTERSAGANAPSVEAAPV